MGAAVIACGDASPVLELGEHVFDLVALAVERFIILQRLLLYRGIRQRQFCASSPLGVMGWTPPDGIDVPKCDRQKPHKGRASVEQVSTVGLDIAKRVFQAHGTDAAGNVMFRKKLARGKVLTFLAAQPPCVVALEACGGAHHWGREIAKLGHEVRLIPPKYVKPFVKLCSPSHNFTNHEVPIMRRNVG